jgi:CheY-like chemotaxis protein
MMLIVFVEDDSNLLEAYIEYTRDFYPDWETLGFLSGEEFLDSGVVPDVVISDYEMPDMSGVELHDIFTEVHPEVPFIILSGAHPPGNCRILWFTKGSQPLTTVLNCVDSQYDQNMEPRAVLPGEEE